jgi:hypothetical protein
MARTLKYRRGQPIRSLDEVWSHFRIGGWFYWIGPRPKHGSIIVKMKVSTVMGGINSKQLCYAIPNETEATP